jgi:hypothetical protein
VLALIRGGRGAKDWTAAAAEPSILHHGWGGRNGDFLVDGSVLMAADGSLPRQIRWSLVTFTLKNQGKNVILLRLNLYSQSFLVVTYIHSHPTQPHT